MRRGEVRDQVKSVTVTGRVHSLGNNRVALHQFTAIPRNTHLPWTVNGRLTHPLPDLYVRNKKSGNSSVAHELAWSSHVIHMELAWQWSTGEA
jgi:hypothetical protein